MCLNPEIKYSAWNKTQLKFNFNSNIIPTLLNNYIEPVLYFMQLWILCPSSVVIISVLNHTKYYCVFFILFIFYKTIFRKLLFYHIYWPRVVNSKILTQTTLYIPSSCFSFFFFCLLLFLIYFSMVGTEHRYFGMLSSGSATKLFLLFIGRLGKSKIQETDP